MIKGGFRKLDVWGRSKNLAILIYRITNNDRYKKDLSLQNQMRRAAVSLASNIAEGDERDTNKESVRFFYIAKGSLAELITQIEISREINYIDKKEFEMILEECEKIGKMLGKLIKVRSPHNP
ncbi:MAG TPA: four helix bundle protein [Syntrophorhabdaceae bacterium]|nr:four helix bundle protein [Syntrophorhabdaceae bacterium]